MARRTTARGRLVTVELLKPAEGKKERAAFYLPVEVIERGRRATYWTPGLTFSDLAAEALSEYIDRLEKKRGGPFPPGQRLVRGRPPVHR